MSAPGESPTKWQAQAFRFGVRRLESAVSSGDPLLRGDQVRRRLNISLIVSIVLSVLLLGGFLVYGFIKPDPSIGSAAVVIDSDTGGVFVSRNGRLYPALNLSSALLAAGRGNTSSNNGKPSVTTVDTDTIGKQPRGPKLGIVGAPNVLPDSSKLLASQWTVCDVTTVDSSLPPGSAPKLSTTAILGRPAPARGDIGTTRAMIVTADGGTTDYLLWQGKRSKIDLGDRAVQLAFEPSDQTAIGKPRPISASLLDVIPASGDIVVPTIGRPSTTPTWAQTLGVTIGEVFVLERADASLSTYVALPDGYQQISPLLGDILRIHNSQDKNLPRVEPIKLSAAPQAPDSELIDADLYPATRPTLVKYTEDATECVTRQGTNTSNARIFALPALPLPASAKTVPVTKPGNLTVDAVYVPPGDGLVLSSTTQNQSTGQASATRPLYLVTDEGVAYPVVSATALGLLGYGADAVKSTAPELIGLLPQGPALDPDDAVHFYPQTGISASSLPSASSSGAAPESSADAGQTPSG